MAKKLTSIRIAESWEIERDQKLKLLLTKMENK